MCRWAILGGFGLRLHELPDGTVSSERCLDELHELPHEHLPRHDRSVVVDSLRSLHCWELLRHNGALGSHGDMRGWAILGIFSVELHELLCGSVSSERRLDELHKLPHRHLPRHDWCVVVVDLCSLHFRQLLWYDGAIGRYGHLRCWDVLGGLGLGVHELRRGSVSSKHRFDELY